MLAKNNKIIGTFCESPQDAQNGVIWVSVHSYVDVGIV